MVPSLRSLGWPGIAGVTVDKARKLATSSWLQRLGAAYQGEQFSLFRRAPRWGCHCLGRMVRRPLALHGFVHYLPMRERPTHL